MPATRLPANFSLPTGRGPIVVIVVHEHDCAQCTAWIDSLAENMPAIQEWGGRIIVAPRAESPANSAPLPIAGPGVVIADEWGEVFFQSKHEHDFPAPQDVMEWVRFIAIQCPECEQPEGEWRNL
ncbi:MAG TPA: hypothetical protein VGD27_15050 [Longimicrobiales bacterium]